MTYEQETKEISAFLRSNCGCLSPSGILTNAADRLDAQAALIEQQAKQIEVLKEITSLAHAGGKLALSESDVLIKIRRLTLKQWNDGNKPNY